MRFAVGLRVRVAAAQCLVAVGILAGDEAGRLLVEDRTGEIDAQRRIANRGRERCVQLSLVEARACAPAAVVRIERGHARRRAVAERARGELDPAILIRTRIDAAAQLRTIRRRRLQHVDGAVYGTGSVERVRRTTQYLDRVRLLGVDLEHLVDVAEPDRPDRHAVLEHEERAAGSRPGEHGRADRRQAFLATAALDQRARHAVQDLGVMGRADGGDGLGCHPGDARGAAERGFGTARGGDDDLLEPRGVRDRRHRDRADEKNDGPQRQVARQEPWRCLLHADQQLLDRIIQHPRRMRRTSRVVC